MEEKSINIKVDAKIHKSIKTLAAEKGISIKDLLLEIIKTYLKEKK
jgi:predicted HicB family RNase H-like nuclease